MAMPSLDLFDTSRSSKTPKAPFSRFRMKPHLSPSPAPPIPFTAREPLSQGEPHNPPPLVRVKVTSRTPSFFAGNGACSRAFLPLSLRDPRAAFGETVHPLSSLSLIWALHHLMHFLVILPDVFGDIFSGRYFQFSILTAARVFFQAPLFPRLRLEPRAVTGSFPKSFS